MYRLLVLVFSFAGIAAAAFTKRWEEMKTKHEWAEIPYGWQDEGAASPDEILNLRIGLKQDGFEELVNHLYTVSDPSHERYGAHLSKEEVDTLIAPHSKSVSLLDAWLAYHGIDPLYISRSDAGDWVSVSVSVSQAESMLGASYRRFHNSASDTTVTRTLRYQLPAILHDHVEVVAPTTYISDMHAMKSSIVKFGNADIITGEEAMAQLQSQYAGAPVPSSCNTTVTPTCLRALYNVNYSPTSLKSELGITGYLEQYPNYNDLTQFYKEFAPEADNFNFTTVLINGGLNNQSDPGVEANLDTQYGEALSFPIKNIFYSTGGSPPFNPDYATPTDSNEPYLIFLSYILAQSNIPSVITTSYGDDEQTVPLEYANAVCSMLAQLGARGISAIFASGDFGVGASPCLSNDGKNATKFMPIFPATCPFVTAVGGTYRIEPEIGIPFSSGGFSYYYERPEYQNIAVGNYLYYLGGKYKGLYNPAGRAVPDVSAQSNNFQIVYDGAVGGVAGTSCSAPTFAALVSLLNDARFASGKSALGFLNPFLYSTGLSGLTDIVYGSNPGCGTEGFNATIGWDPVTGLGTPDFAKLRTLLALAP